MVRIIDVTEEKERKKREAKLEKELAKECFKGREVEFIGEDFCINISDKSQKLASKMFGIPKMGVYDESVLSQVEGFAQRYEVQFNRDDFVIELDYSENS